MAHSSESSSRNSGESNNPHRTSRHSTTRRSTTRRTAALTHVTHDAFGPLWAPDSRVLMLGSIPSPKSREFGFYYMHPRNRFWPVLAAIFDEQVPASIEERRGLALRHHIALFDSLVECDIVGASDASIRNPVPADLRPLLAGSRIHAIFCTGATAAKYFTKWCDPMLRDAGFDIPMTQLPSTSPANAAWSLERLVAAYDPVREAAEAEG